MNKILQYLKQNKPIKQIDLTLFLRQFATLIAAGVPLIKCCDLLEKSQEQNALRLLIYTIKRDLSAGKNLFYSLRRHPHFFDDLTCQLIHIGEETGKLDFTLNLIANDWEKKLAFKMRLHQALFYPGLLLITALCITMGMLLFVIPKFAELFQDWQSQLPLITIFIFNLSALLQKNLFVILLSITVIMALMIKIKFMRNRFDKGFNQIKLFKLFTHKLIVARFVRTLSITFAAGLPILKGLKLTRHISNQRDYLKIIRLLCEKITSGHSLHQALASSFYFPVIVVQMIKIGEESGNLPPMLNKVADFFEADIDRLISYFSRFLETLILLILGVLIGGLVISMYLPIFKLGNVL